MKLREIWINKIEVLFNDLPIVKDIFYYRFEFFELLYSEEIFISKLTYFIKKHFINLKNFEIINKQLSTADVNNFGKKTINKSVNNSTSNNTNREQYTGYNVDGDFKKTLTDTNANINNNGESLELLNPIDLLSLMNKASNVKLLDPFLNESELLFRLLYPCNV